VSQVDQAPPAELGVDAQTLAKQFGMQRAGARPPFGQYLRDLWARRHFIFSYTRAVNAVTYSKSILGQLWQVLTPLLNAAVYYLIFGVLLHTRRGTHNFIAFIVVGVFIFTFMSRAFITGSRSVTNNMGIIRALHFPRASLPLSTTAIAFQQLLFSMLVAIPVVIFTGEPIRRTWVLLIPVLICQFFFTLGVSLIIARISAQLPDTQQLLPFVIRTWFYLSGMFFSIAVFTRGHSTWVRYVLELNPGAIYPELGREALLTQQHTYSYAWLGAIGWAVATFVFGLFFFWVAEERYGRA
jgi:teichoic acid transport system permease protein